MNSVKTTKASEAYSGIIASLLGNDIINGYFGGFNLLAEYLNDYFSSNLNFSIVEWINENIADLDQYDINSILENPDWIMLKLFGMFIIGLIGFFRAMRNMSLKTPIIQTGNIGISGMFLLCHCLTSARIILSLMQKMNRKHIRPSLWILKIIF